MIFYTKHMITLSLPVSFYAAHVLTPPSFEHACLHNDCRCRPWHFFQVSKIPLIVDIVRKVPGCCLFDLILGCVNCIQDSRNLLTTFTYSWKSCTPPTYNPVRKLEESRDCLPDVFSVPSGNLFASPLSLSPLPPSLGTGSCRRGHSWTERSQ